MEGTGGGGVRPLDVDLWLRLCCSVLLVVLKARGGFVKSFPFQWVTSLWLGFELAFAYWYLAFLVYFQLDKDQRVFVSRRNSRTSLY